MTDDKTYNGWTNYETWVTKLWMDNDSYSYQYWQEVAQETFDSSKSDKYFTKEERAALDLADRIKDEHEESKPEQVGLCADLLNAAFSEINWFEIARNLLENVNQ